jgi:tRNA(Arg) A34 adenosine deaminase TadA
MEEESEGLTIEEIAAAGNSAKEAQELSHDTAPEKEEEKHDWNKCDSKQNVPQKCTKPELRLFWDRAHGEFLWLGRPQQHRDCPEAVHPGTWSDYSEALERLFDYPHGFERFYAVLLKAKSSTSKADDVHKRFSEGLKAKVSAYLSDKKENLIPVHKTMFGVQKKKKEDQKTTAETMPPSGRKSTGDSRAFAPTTPSEKNSSLQALDPKVIRPLQIFATWFEGHSKNSKCECFSRIGAFIRREKDSFRFMTQWMQLLYFFSEQQVFHFSDLNPSTLLSDDLLHPPPAFIFCERFDSSFCIFSEKYSKAFFDIVCSKSPMSIEMFVSMQKHSSSMTARWLRRYSGHNLKLWAHMPKHASEKCEIEKYNNCGEKWRHMIFSYAVMALLWNEFNGNKEGPIGDYPLRSAQKIGSVRDELHVYASKEHGVPVDYNGHNIVALAVGKKGNILRIAYNHNTLFSSTVDHAEERLIDGLFKDPTLFVPRCHAQVYGPMSKVDIEKHMQHISVYTSLEPCQQCSGKLHLASVPEVISCQRDVEIKLLGNQLYDQFHKCRAILGSYFDFSPYDDLGRTYKHFSERVGSEVFFQPPNNPRAIPSKATMPYFLCTDEAHDIFERGHVVFDHVFRILFHQLHKPRSTFNIGVEKTLPQIPFFNCPSRELTKQDQIDLLNLYNLDISQWISGEKESTETGSKSICSFRPSLAEKRNRILHDELLHLRNHWVSKTFKDMCSLKFFFDQNSIIHEMDIEAIISPLGDIHSIDLTRNVEGLLIGLFTVTFTSSATSHRVKEAFDQIYIGVDGRSNFKPGYGFSLSNRRQFLAAADWLHSMREPLSLEIFLPLSASISSVFVVEGNQSFLNGQPIQAILQETTMKRRWPSRGDEIIRVIKCSDAASARRLKFALPNFDAPNITRIAMIPGFDTTIHVDATEIFSITKDLGQSFTFIARKDVSESFLLRDLSKFMSQKGSKRLLPKYLRVSCSTLKTCDDQALQWLCFVKNDSSKSVQDDVKCFTWKTWQIQFLSSDVQLDLDHFASFSREHFCQPFPHSVTKFAVALESRSVSHLKHFKVFCDWVGWFKLSIDTPSNSQNSEDPDNMKFVLRVILEEDSKEAIRIQTKKIVSHIDFIVSKGSFQPTRNCDKPHKSLRIDIRESSLVTLILSNMLFNNREDILRLLSIISKTSNQKQKKTRTDFWGYNLTISSSKDHSEVKGSELDDKFPDWFVNSLIEIRRNNLLQLVFKDQNPSNPAGLEHKLEFSSICDPSRRQNRFMCKYCGIWSEFPDVLPLSASHEAFAVKSMLCAAHTTALDPRSLLRDSALQLPNPLLQKKSSGYKLNVTDWTHDASKDAMPVKMMHLEKCLDLELSVQNKFFVFSSVKSRFNSAHKSHETPNFEQILQIRHNSDQIGNLSVVMRRDEFNGPAHVRFCFYTPSTVSNVHIFFHIALNPMTRPFFGPVPVQETKLVSCKDKLGFKGQKIYGLLPAVTSPPVSAQYQPSIVTFDGSDAAIGNDSEGGVIIAPHLRMFFEPEYFPELFFDFETEKLEHPQHPVPNAILSAEQLPEKEQKEPHTPQHVRNHSYVVRWEGRAHSQNSHESYDSVFASPAFREFIQGSALVGHVPPPPQCHEHRHGYPFMFFTHEDKRFCNLHTWDFAEFQTDELAALLACQKRVLHNDFELRIAEEQKTQLEKWKQKSENYFSWFYGVLANNLKALERDRKALCEQYEICFKRCLSIFNQQLPDKISSFQARSILETLKFLMQDDADYWQDAEGAARVKKPVFEQVS